MKPESTLQTAIFMLTGILCFLGAGCVSVPEQSRNGEDTFTACAEPRPEICTQEYVPVCGYLVDGNQKTYSNACSACSDKNTIKYEANPCP